MGSAAKAAAALLAVLAAACASPPADGPPRPAADARVIRLHDVRDLLSPGPGRDPVFTGGEPLLAFAHGALDRSCWCGGFPETTLENGLLVVLADADSQERLAGEFRALRAAAGGE